MREDRADGGPEYTRDGHRRERATEGRRARRLGVRSGWAPQTLSMATGVSVASGRAATEPSDGVGELKNWEPEKTDPVLICPSRQDPGICHY
jgi:hypothetical protein